MSSKMKYFYKIVYTLCVFYRVTSAQENQTVPQPVIPSNATYLGKPPDSAWVGLYNDRVEKRQFLGDWLIKGCWNISCTFDTAYKPKEYEGYDGFYNNPSRVDLGAIDTALLRRLPAAYKDGSYQPSLDDRPNPFELSALLKGESATQSRHRNVLLVFFGQQVVEEILDAQRAACPPEYINIPIPPGHEYSNKVPVPFMPVLRTRYDRKTGHSPNNPRQQLNEITPYLDGGLVYGTTKAWSDLLRMYKNGSVDENGLLASSDPEGLFPERNTIRLPMANPPAPVKHHEFIMKHELDKVERFYKLGNPRGNENPFLLTFGVFWYRWHNYMARSLKRIHSDWSGEKIYNEARKWVIATQQHIVVNVWLKEWIGEPDGIGSYQGYNPGIDPQIDQFFQAAAFRFGHTLVPSGVYLREYGRNGCRAPQQLSIRTCNSFWRPETFLNVKNETKIYSDIDYLLMGMALQPSEKEDHMIVEDLRGRVFGPLEFSRRDLMALNIQRGRDHGLPDFNSIRKIYGLEPFTSFSNFSQIPDHIRTNLSTLYKGSLDNIDLWVGGILETEVSEGRPGTLFRAIIKDQFRRIRDGDRFWFENEQNGLFTRTEIDRIKSVQMYDLIMVVTKMDFNDIPKNAFKLPTDDKEIHSNCSSKLNRANGYFFLPPIDGKHDNCTDLGTYDYFSNSELSFILSFSVLAAFIAGLFGLIWQLNILKTKEMGRKAVKMSHNVRQSLRFVKQTPYTANEIVERKQVSRPVVLLLNVEKKQIQVLNQRGDILRILDGSYPEQNYDIFIVSDDQHIVIRTLNEYDLVLMFESEFIRRNFLDGLEKFISDLQLSRKRHTINLKAMMKNIVTFKDRQKQLDKFFRVVFSQAFKIPHSEEEILTVDTTAAQDVIHTELTLNEFADALKMKADSNFVTQMFSYIDKDKNGFISFREFVDMLVILSGGSMKNKLKLLFDIYDINNTGKLTQEDFINMIRSLTETVSAAVEQEHLENTITDMIQRAGLQKKKGLSFDDFLKVLGPEIGEGANLRLGFGTESLQQYMLKTQEKVENIYGDPHELRRRVRGEVIDDSPDDNVQDNISANLVEKEGLPPTIWRSINSYFERNYRQIFWLVLYTFVLLSIFAERAYYYTILREHSGLRRIAGYGVTITRGAASAQMFCYSTLLLTMCRNTITVLRDTALHVYIPFDSAVDMHKYIAVWGFFFTVLHIVGHGFNFYHISTQTSDDLTCLFRNFFHSTHEIPKFHYWCWQTMTGFTGVVATMIWAMIYAFSIPFVRRKLYNWFWYTHSLYPLFYIFMILHGTGRLIQEPFFFYFFLGPVILFTLDTMYSLSRKKIEIPVLRAELLPSNVTMLEFPRPNYFEYKSGQWVRIACLGHSAVEYHPFTISSSPDEPTLTVHIRAVGPWTSNIRELYNPTLLGEQIFPKIYLDGPFGEAHQDWYQYDVSILIGGGIGVTPFASILKDIVYKANQKHKFKCRKVYFLWVTRTQKQFEWLVDIIRDVENSDQNRLVTVHLFITQFYEKYDLRTVLLYICEKHFQRIANRSLFTGLSAVTHFGRPKFELFFKALKSVHSNSSKIGVFSCGPLPMTRSVDKACVNTNSDSTTPIFQHHFKNF